jgi:hypothetical protein
MSTLRTIIVCALPIIAISVCFHRRHLFLIELTPESIRRARPALAWLLLMPLAALVICWELLRSPFWGSNLVFDLSPLLITFGFIFQVLLFSHMAEQWRRSPLFILAIMQPIVGCLLMTLIWWHDRHPRRIETDEKL